MSISTLTCPFCEAKIDLNPGSTIKECPSCHKPLHTPVGTQRETATFKLNENNPVPPPSPLPHSPGPSFIQKNLGPYRIERNIGRGGMGFVYEATDTRLNRKVALKTIESGGEIDETIINRFRREAQSAGRLRHPNIVSVHDVGKAGGFDYFTMDLVDGMTFDKWLQATQSTLKDRVRILEKVARALDYAHQQGIIHRDVKPGNIMIDSSGEPQIMDFGLARNTKDSSNLTLSGSIVGTPAYMAPEQTMGSSSEVGAKTDVWALGVVAYEVFTGKPPFDNGNVYQTIYAVLHNDPEPPRKLNPEIPRNLEIIILKCLEKQVARRYQSTGAMADDLKAWLEDRSIEARGIPWWKRWIKKLGGKKAISMDEFILEQQARQRAESQRLELQSKVESESKQEWRLVFEENFMTPDIESRWEIVGGKWEMGNGRFRLWDGEPQILYLKKGFIGDIRMEFECHQDSRILSDISCFMHAIPMKNREKACESGYMIQYGGNGNTRSFIERPGKRLWDKRHSPIIRGEHYRMAVEKWGNKLSLWVNDLLIFEVEDDSPLSGPDRNSLGIYGWMASTHYSSIKVYQLGAPVKGDMLEVASRQLEKGRLDSAMDLFQEIIDSSEDPLRIQQAQQGIQTVMTRQKLKQNLPHYQATILSHWPKARIESNEKGICLDISRQKARDLSPLLEIPLDELMAVDNQIEDASPLKNSSLSLLNLQFNQIKNLDFLRGNTSLRTLNVSYNQIHDIEPLSGMQLETLVVGDNPIEKIEMLANISMTYLSCSGLHLKNLEFARHLPLIRFTCQNNKITDLSPLKDKPLRNLLCNNNQIKDLSPLGGMAIHSLGIHQNMIESLEPLRGMKTGFLRCYSNSLTSLEPFYKDPPYGFFFDCKTLSNDELERAARFWEKTPSHAHHVKNARVIQYIREGNVEKLKKLAAVHDGNQYLHIPQFITWEEARLACERVGGKLFTAKNEGELKILEELAPQHINTWIHCMGNEDYFEWLSEKTSREELLGKNLHPASWNRGKILPAYNPSSYFSFLIQWDTAPHGTPRAPAI